MEKRKGDAETTLHQIPTGPLPNWGAFLHIIPDVHCVRHKLLQNTRPFHNVKHDDTQVPPKRSRDKKQPISCHSVWLDMMSLTRVLSVEFVELGL
jgi:hypothetical protein